MDQKMFVVPVPDIFCGRSVGQLAAAATKAIVLGLIKHGNPLAEPIPSLSTKLESGDQVVCVARTYAAAEHVSMDLNLPHGIVSAVKQRSCRRCGGMSSVGVCWRCSEAGTPEGFVLVLIGYSSETWNVIEILDQQVSHRSEVHILLSEEDDDELKQKARKARLGNITLVKSYVGSTTDADAIAELPLDTAAAIVIFADNLKAGEDGARADAEAITTAFLADWVCNEQRSSQANLDFSKGKIICELIDDNSRQLVSFLSSGYRDRCQIQFFERNAIETGLFAQAFDNPIQFNMVVRLLDCGSTEHSRHYVNIMSIHDLIGRDSPFVDSWIKLADQVRTQFNGAAVLLGYVKVKPEYEGLALEELEAQIPGGIGGSGWRIDDTKYQPHVLNPSNVVDTEWHPNDLLVIVRKPVRVSELRGSDSLTVEPAKQDLPNEGLPIMGDNNLLPNI